MLTMRLLAVIAALAFLLPLFECGPESKSKAAEITVENRRYGERLINEFCTTGDGPRWCELIKKLGDKVKGEDEFTSVRLTRSDGGGDIVLSAFIKVVGDELRRGKGNGLSTVGGRAKFIGYEITRGCEAFRRKCNGHLEDEWVHRLAVCGPVGIGFAWAAADYWSAQSA